MIDAFEAQIEQIPTFLHNLKYIYFIYRVQPSTIITKTRKDMTPRTNLQDFAENKNQD